MNERALRALENCRLCALDCGANRLAGENSHCGCDQHARIFKHYVSYAEELDLIPALMVYFSGCNLRCRFCTQVPGSHDGSAGRDVLDSEAIDAIAAGAQNVRWINLVGGEPSLHPHAIIELRQRIAGLCPGEAGPARWLLNTNGYFTPECLELIDPCLDLYVVDFKFGTDACAAALAGVPRYVNVLTGNLAAIYARGPDRLLIRHLLLPGHERCCLEPLAFWVAKHLPGVRFHLMSSYVPAPLVLADPELGRTVPQEALQHAQAWCEHLRLNLVQ